MLDKIAASIKPNMLIDETSAQRFMENQKANAILFSSGIFILNKNGVVIAEYLALRKLMINQIPASHSANRFLKWRKTLTWMVSKS